MIYRHLKLGVMSLVFALGLFGGVSLFSTETASAQSIGGGGIFLPLIANGQAVDTTTNAGPFDVAEAEAEAALYEKAIAEMEQNISIDEDGQLFYDGLVALSPDITPEIQLLLLDALDETNEALGTGEITLDELVWLDDVETPNDELVALHGCGGRNRTTSHWWGKKRYRDSCKSNEIVAVMAAAAAGGGVCAATATGSVVGLPVAPFCAGFAGGAGVLAAIVQGYNADGSGTIFYYTRGGIPFRIGSQ